MAPPPAGPQDQAFLTVFLWGLVWGALVVLTEAVAWLSFRVFEYDLTGGAWEPLRFKVGWIAVGVVAGWMAGIGIGVAARWTTAAGGFLTLGLASVLLVVVNAAELGVSQVVTITTTPQYVVFMGIDAFLCSILAIVLALTAARPGRPVGFRALLAVPFWILASVISTAPYLPPIYADIVERFL